MEAFHTSTVAKEASESNMSPAATAVCHSIELANRVVFQLSQDQGSYKGMGSTAAVAYFFGDTLVTANVGDSRIYLIREDEIEQLTQDHTLLAEHMRKNPDWDPNSASIPMKHILVRAVGIHEAVEADVYETQFLAGDLILMCSDGLTDMLSDEEIHQAVLEGGELEEVCGRLVSMANERGGLDNITAVLLLVQREEKGLLQKLFRSK
jgi:protein phosphatase